jgi:hypothetical protein
MFFLNIFNKNAFLKEQYCEKKKNEVKTRYNFWNYQPNLSWFWLSKIEIFLFCKYFNDENWNNSEFMKQKLFQLKMNWYITISIHTKIWMNESNYNQSLLILYVTKLTFSFIILKRKQSS